jgi:large subunit ribosomal protein L6
MSRIGKQPIALPSGVTITQTESLVEVTGPKGLLKVDLLDGVVVSVEESTLIVGRETDEASSAHGLIRTLLQNSVTGVSTGWTKGLELNGVGMRAILSGSDLTLSLGFSHPVVVPAPAGISFQVVKNVVTVSGIDKQLVGETAARIRKLRKPEPYKGKGIRYVGEYVRRKAGKTGKAGK